MMRQIIQATKATVARFDAYPTKSRYSTRNRVAGVAAWIACAVVPAQVTASETHYLKRNELFCSVAEEICIRGTVSYEVNPRLLRLHGRVQSATGPGLLRIRVSGTNRLGHRRIADMEITLRGRYSEIIDFKMIPDHPDIANWEVSVVSYELTDEHPDTR